MSCNIRRQWEWEYDASGRFLIVDRDPARVWDIRTGRCVLTIDDFRADTVNWSFTENGAALVTAGSGTVSATMGSDVGSG